MTGTTGENIEGKGNKQYVGPYNFRLGGIGFTVKKSI